LTIVCLACGCAKERPRIDKHAMLALMEEVDALSDEVTELKLYSANSYLYGIPTKGPVLRVPLRSDRQALGPRATAIPGWNPHRFSYLRAVESALEDSTVQEWFFDEAVTSYTLTVSNTEAPDAAWFVLSINTYPHGRISHLGLYFDRRMQFVRTLGGL
jgi:hypothetical protein